MIRAVRRRVAARLAGSTSSSNTDRPTRSSGVRGPEQRRRPLVGEDHHPVAVGQDRVGRGLDQRPVARLALAQRRLDRVPLPRPLAQRHRGGGERRPTRLTSRTGVATGSTGSPRPSAAPASASSRTGRAKRRPHQPASSSDTARTDAALASTVSSRRRCGASTTSTGTPTATRQPESDERA